jgi:hypothetical protein
MHVAVAAAAVVEEVCSMPRISVVIVLTAHFAVMAIQAMEAEATEVEAGVEVAMGAGVEAEEATEAEVTRVVVEATRVVVVATRVATDRHVPHNKCLRSRIYLASYLL